MSVDLEKVNRAKERILSHLKFRGPSLPIHIARAINIEPIFTSAFLSELKSEQKLKYSHMKVGSSSIYYLDGQEAQLENFTQYLNQREKEAFHLLKTEKVLQDETQNPVIRVALRAIKDFAIPIRVKVDENVVLFWKFFLLSQEEVVQLVEKKLPKSSNSQSIKPIPPEINSLPTQEDLPQKTEQITENPKPALSVNSTENNQEKLQEKIKEAIEKIKPKKEEETQKEEPIEVNEKERSPPKIWDIKKKEKEQEEELKLLEETQEKEKPKTLQNEFPLQTQKQLSLKHIKIENIESEKRKEFSGVISIHTSLGKQEFYFIAKDKKSVSDSDLSQLLQKIQSEKRPAIFIAPGKPNKKAEQYLEKWGNLIKFLQI